MNEGIIFFALIIPFFIFANILSQGKGVFLLAGYNTLPDHEKKI